MFRSTPELGIHIIRQLSGAVFTTNSCRVLSTKVFPRTSMSDHNGQLSPRGYRVGLSLAPSVTSMPYIQHRTITHYIESNDSETQQLMEEDLQVIEDFVTEEEEQSLVEEVEPYLKRLHYEKDHWDDAIQGYRETERKKWRDKNKGVLQRLRKFALPPGEGQIGSVHVLDLAEDGYIKPHIDSVRFCGSTIAGLSLLSSSIMRFVHEEDKTSVADVLLKRRSLYIIRNRVRYNYTHEILSNEESVFKGVPIHKGRRISVICRTEPRPS